jgi:hypothetical protein
VSPASLLLREIRLAGVTITSISNQVEEGTSTRIKVEDSIQTKGKIEAITLIREESLTRIKVEDSIQTKGKIEAIIRTRDKDGTSIQTKGRIGAIIRTRDKDGTSIQTKGRIGAIIQIRGEDSTRTRDKRGNTTTPIKAEVERDSKHSTRIRGKVRAITLIRDKAPTPIELTPLMMTTTKVLPRIPLNTVSLLRSKMTTGPVDSAEVVGTPIMALGMTYLSK